MKKIYYTFLGLILLVMSLPSCGTYSPARVVVMQHPKTLQTAECKVDPWGHVNRKLQVESCVDAYSQAGYEKLSDSHSEK